MKTDDLEPLKAALKGLELPYREGAWENFLQGSTKKRKVLFPASLLKIAAVLVLIQLLPVRLDEVPLKQTIRKSISIVGKKMDRVRVPAPEIVLSNHVTKIKTGLLPQLPNQLLHVIPQLNAKSSSQFSVLKINLGSEENVATSDLPIPRSYERNPVAKGAILSPSDLAKPDKQGNSGRLAYAVGFGNALDSRSIQKISLSLGVRYQLSKKFALNGALNYSSFGAKKRFEPSGEASGRHLSVATANLAGLALPVDLEFSTSKKSYIKAGLTAAVLTSATGQLDIEEKITSFATFSDASGNQQVKEVTNISYFQEPISQEKLTGPHILIFYNLSAGYRFPLVNKLSLGIEPFIKLPASSFSGYGLKLVQFGLKANFEF